jgi:hypothetical protein
MATSPKRLFCFVLEIMMKMTKTVETLRLPIEEDAVAEGELGSKKTSNHRSNKKIENTPLPTEETESVLADERHTPVSKVEVKRGRGRPRKSEKVKAPTPIDELRHLEVEVPKDNAAVLAEEHRTVLTEDAVVTQNVLPDDHDPLLDEAVVVTQKLTAECLFPTAEKNAPTAAALPEPGNNRKKSSPTDILLLLATCFQFFASLFASLSLSSKLTIRFAAALK